MKKCSKCGAVIVNGVNGCMLLEDCFICHGPVKYSEPQKTCNKTSIEELNYTEEKCISSV